MPPLRGKDGESGNIFAGFALGLRGVARPEADGLNAKKGVIAAGGRARALLGASRSTCQQTCNQREQ